MCQRPLLGPHGDLSEAEVRVHLNERRERPLPLDQGRRERSGH
jgi:hypothetical protein